MILHKDCSASNPEEQTRVTLKHSHHACLQEARHSRYLCGYSALMSSTLSPALFDLSPIQEQLTEWSKSYATGSPYPHIVLDDFFPAEIAQQARDAFPAIQDEGWIHYVHVNERKHGLNKMDLLPPFLANLIRELNTPAFVSWISQLTGIPNLMADPDLEGGGLHQSQRGGHLNVHADFTVHPHKRMWRRRVNLLVYLNEGWQAEWGGALELWDRDMSRSVIKIEPLFNRVVLFNTDEDSYHGFPDAIQCPEEVTRKSIALYYFTEEKMAPAKRATNYRARPGDGIKGLFIWADKQAVAVYNGLKGLLGINDDLISSILGRFSRKKKR